MRFVFWALSLGLLASTPIAFSQSPKATVTIPVLEECVRFLADEHLKPGVGVVYAYEPFRLRLVTHPRVAGMLTVHDYVNDLSSRALRVTGAVKRLCGVWATADVELEVQNSLELFANEFKNRKAFDVGQMYIVVEGSTVKFFSEVKRFAPGIRRRTTEKKRTGGD